MNHKAGWLLVFLAAAPMSRAGSSAMDDYNQAWIAMGQLRYDGDVVANLKGIISKDKTFYRAYRSLAEVYVKRHEIGVGESYFRELSGKDPANELAHYGWGEVLRLRGDLDGASQEYRTCASMNPRSFVCQDSVREFGFPGLANAARGKAQQEYFNKLRARDTSNPVLFLEEAYALEAERGYGKARDLAARAVDAARKTDDRELKATFLAALGDWTARAGGGFEQQLEAERNALDASKEFDDLEEQINYRQGLAKLIAKLGRPEEAIALLKKILEETTKLGHIPEQADVHWEMARLFSRIGEIDQAIEHFRKGDEFGIKAGAPPWAGPVASLHARRGEYRTAIDLTLQDIKQLRERHDLWDVAHSLRNLGNWHMELGAYAKALDYGEQSVKLFQELGHDHVANAGISNLGNIYAALGDYSRALSCTLRGLKSGREHGDASEVQRNLGNLADIYFRRGDLPQAFKAWAETLAMSPKVRMPLFEAGVFLSRCSAYEQMGRYDLALRDASAGLAIERRLQFKPDLGYALNRVGFLNLKAGQIDTATRFFQEALDLAEQAGLREISWEARQGLGLSEERRGHLSAALEHYRKAITDIEAIRGQNLAPELTVNFLQDRLVVYQDAVALLQRLHAADLKHGFDGEAFRITEQSRARAFLDSLAESKIQVTKGISPEQRDLELRLKAAVSQANLNLARKTTPVTQAALRQAEDGLTDWTIRLRDSNPRYQELRYPAQYTVERVQRELLGDSEALVEYFVGKADLFAWVITRSSASMVRLPGLKRMERDIREYRLLLSQRPAGEAALTQYRLLSQRLHAALIAPLLSAVEDTKQLVIVPDGILYYLPFETLLSRKDKFLVEDYTVTYVPSASVLGSLRRDLAPRGAGRLELLAFGDPSFNGHSNSPTTLSQSPGELVRSAMEAGGRRFTQLPMTRMEVNGIAQLFPAGGAVVRLGSEASESALKREDLSRFKRIHFATHAVLDEENPQRSGIVLTLPGTDGEDGILQPREIMDLDIRADLVVLSACETALGKIVRGEGMVGLTRAFFYAGAPRAVVSLWKVDDTATSDLMKAFYGELRRDDNVARALRAAKMGMIHSDVVRYRHPYFWAPFILTGAN